MITKQAYIRLLELAGKACEASHGALCALLAEIPAELQDDEETRAVWLPLDRKWRGFLTHGRIALQRIDARRAQEVLRRARAKGYDLKTSEGQLSAEVDSYIEPPTHE